MLINLINSVLVHYNVNHIHEVMICTSNDSKDLKAGMGMSCDHCNIK